jgi:hypothetical protein
MLEATRGVTAGKGGRTGSWALSEGARRELLARLSVMSLLERGRPVGGQSNATAEACAVARAWLDLVHSGRSASSWAVAALPFKEIVGPDDWRVALRSLRVTLGRCLSRRLESLSSREGSPGLPPGPYVVIRFESSFEGREGVIETVTTRRGDDGHWRAAAYFVT